MLLSNSYPVHRALKRETNYITRLLLENGGGKSEEHECQVADLTTFANNAIIPMKAAFKLYGLEEEIHNSNCRL